MISNHHGFNPKKNRRFNLIQPRTIGISLLILSIGLMLYQAYRDNTSTSFLTRAIMVPVSIIQKVRTTTVTSVNNIRNAFSSDDMVSRLQEEVRDLKQQNINLRMKVSELDSYRAAFHFQRIEESPEAFPGIVAVVVGHLNMMTDALIINRGANDDLEVNLPVLAKEGLIGRTEKVSRHFTRVQPITDPGFSIGVYIEGTAYEAFLQGSPKDSGKLMLTDMHLIGGEDDTSPIQPGQKVLTSGRGLLFPRDLVAGTIAEVSDNGTVEGISVNPVTVIDTVEAVIVLTTPTLQKEMLSLIEFE